MTSQWLPVSLMYSVYILYTFCVAVVMFFCGLLLGQPIFKVYNELCWHSSFHLIMCFYKDLTWWILTHLRSPFHQHLCTQHMFPITPFAYFVFEFLKVFWLLTEEDWFRSSPSFQSVMFKCNFAVAVGENSTYDWICINDQPRIE